MVCVGNIIPDVFGEKWESLQSFSFPSFANARENFDFFVQTWYQFFVDESHIINFQWIPWDLIPIYSDFTFNASKQFSLRKIAAEHFSKMAWAFSHDFDFKVKFSINSAYRNTAFQRTLYHLLPHQQVAVPWTSEHELGLALDLWVNGKWMESDGGKYFERMKENAYKYWFHNSYQKWIEIDGKMKEPWHWRYVWLDLARYLHKMDLSFAEYFYSQYPKQ